MTSRDDIQKARYCVLLVEDDDDHATIIRRQLTLGSGGSIVAHRVDRLSSAMQFAHEQRPDAILLDLRLPDSDPGETLESIIAGFPDAAVIVLTALDDEGTGLSAVQHGAQDYLVKTRISGDLLRRSIQYAIERKRSERNVRLANRRLQFLSDAAGELLRHDDPTQVLDSLYQRLAAMLGLDVYFHFNRVEESEELRLAGYSGVAPELVERIRRIDLGATVCGRVAEDAKAVTIENVLDRDDPMTAFVREIGVATYSCRPLIAKNTLIGTLSFGSTQPIRFSDEDHALMHAFADLVASAIDRQRAQDALRASEERLAIALSAGQMGAWEWNVQTNKVTWSPTLEAIHGIGEGTFEGDFSAYKRDMHPDDHVRVLTAIRRAVDERSDYHVVYRIIRPNGEIAWLEARGRVELDDDGEPVRMIGVCMDVSERHWAEENLRESRERLRAALEASETGTFRWYVQSDRFDIDEELSRLIASGRGRQITRLRDFVARLHPDDQEQVYEQFRTCALTGADLDLQLRVRLFNEQVRWLEGKGKVVTDARGRVTYMTGACLEITQRKRWEEQQELLLAELSHRVKNTLATVQAIASQTAHQATTMDEFRASFGGRIRALSQAHSLLSMSGWEGAELEELLRRELEPYDLDRVQFEGPAVVLTPKPALTLQMALHELTTNAAKYGALRSDRGLIQVRWSIVDDHGDPRRLQIDWIESGLAQPAPGPSRRGFGTRLIESSVAYELGGDANLRFLPEGLHCRIAFPWLPRHGFIRDRESTKDESSRETEGVGP